MLLDVFCCNDSMEYVFTEKCNTGETKELSRIAFTGMFSTDIQGYNSDGVGEQYTSDAVAYIPIEAEDIENGFSLETRPLVGGVIEFENNAYRIVRVTRLKDYSGDCCEIVGFKLELETKCLACV